MSAAAQQARIELPHWFAGFAFDARPGEGRPVPGGAVRLGGLDVFQPESGAELVTFGAPGDPSVALFEGYLFDRAQLCEELRLPAAVTNAGIVAAAFEAWGTGIFSRLAGSYLLAVWDARTRRLLLGHDALGRHPVFYAPRPDALWFGSNVLALARAGRFPNDLNRLSLAFAAFTLWPEAGETFFTHIRRLAPGHYLEVSADGTTRQQQYWHPLPQGDDEWLTEREVLDEFEPALVRAVDRCMQMVPEGIMLSGGVDSVTIAALAGRYRQAHGQPPIVAISGRADVPLMQEEQMQARAVEALQLRHIVTKTSDWTQNRDDISVALEATPGLPGPSRIYWVGTYMGFYRTSVAQGLHTVLTGSGGDNWLAVADIHAADLIRRLRVSQLAQFISASARTGGSSYPVAMRQLLWHGGVRALADSLAARVLPGPKARFHRRRAEALVPAWLCPDPRLRTEFIERLLERRPPSLDASGRFPANYYQHTLGAVRNPHLYYEFETAFHIDAMCGVRLLSPYHDRDLVNFFTRIPPVVLVHGNKYKGLLRPVVEKYLPGLGFGQQRKDYPKPALDLDDKSLRDGVVSAWSSQRFSALPEMGVVDADVSRLEAERAPTHTFDALVRMFALMSAETWVKARRA